MIIDFHTHCFNDALAPLAMKNLAKDSMYPPHYDGTLNGLKSSMAEAGIDISVILNIATNPRQNVKVNDWAIEANRADGIVAFGSIHPDFEGYKDELARLKAGGIKGVKFHPDYQDFFVDDERAFKVYAEAERLGFIMTFHCGNDLVPRAPLHCTPERLMRVAETFPKAKIVGAHLGGQNMWEEVFRHIAGKNVYVDTSFGFKFMTKEQIERFLAVHPHDRILFASDTPWQKQSVEVAEMEAFVPDAALRERIFYSNAARLLGIL